MLKIAEFLQKSLVLSYLVDFLILTFELSSSRLGSDMHTPCRVFFICMDAVKGFFFTIERALTSHITVVFFTYPGLLWV